MNTSRSIICEGQYCKVDAERQPAACRVCGEGYVGQMRLADLKSVLEEGGLDWKLNGAIPHYAEMCPRCRRRLLGANHNAIVHQSYDYGGLWQN